MGVVTLQDNSQQKLRPPLTVNWTRGKDMPIKMSERPLCIVIEGCAYIHGGYTVSSLDPTHCTVIKLDLQRNDWTKLPQYNANYFAMTSLANQLVLVGGYDPVTRKATNRITLFTTRRWINPYPPMNTARWSSTAVCFNNYIIVAGGHGDGTYTSSVELLDVEARRWYTAESLLNPRNGMNSTVVGNTLYLMGGYDDGYTNVVHMVDLNELITKAVFKEAIPTLWQVISDTPLKRSAPLNVRGSLLAVGGRDGHLKPPSSSIHLYQPDTRKWVKVGDLPTAFYNWACSVLPSGDVIVAGDPDLGGYTSIYFLSISNAY